jgi:hypothetical protein
MEELNRQTDLHAQPERPQRVQEVTQRKCALVKASERHHTLLKIFES